MSLRERIAGWFGKAADEGEPAAAPGNGNGAGATAAANGAVAPWGNQWPLWGSTAGAENISTLTSCVDVISSALASLPALVYENLGNGERREAPDHPVARMLAQPNDLQSWPDLVRFFMSSVLLAGNALVEVRRNGNGQPTALLPIVWTNAQPVLIPAPPGQSVGPLAPSGRLAFDILRVNAPFGGTGTPRRMFADSGELFYLRERSNTGILGVSRLQRAPMVVEQALRVQEFATFLWTNAATPDIALTHPGKLSKEAGDRIAQSWQSTHVGPYNARRTVVLEEGMEAKPLSASAEDSEVLESRKFAAEEVCRLYGVPPQLVGITSASNFANSQQASIWFGVHCLRPWAKAIEAEFARSVFVDPDRFELELDLSGLVRGDFTAQVAAGVQLLRAGCLTQNEVRAQLGFNPMPGGDVLIMQSVGGRPPGAADSTDTLPEPGAPTNGTGRNGAATGGA